MWDLFMATCTIVGMLTVYAVGLGALLVWALRSVQQRQARREGRLADGAPMGIDRRARSWDELPEWISQDREWASAVVVLGSTFLAHRTNDLVDFGTRTVDWEALRAAAAHWDDDESNLVAVADRLAHAGAPSGEPGEAAAGVVAPVDQQPDHQVPGAPTPEPVVTPVPVAAAPAPLG